MFIFSLDPPAADSHPSCLPGSSSASVDALGTTIPELSMFTDCFLESASSPPCKRAAAHFVSTSLAAMVDLVGKSLERMTKCLLLLLLGLPWKEGWLQGSSRTLLKLSEKHFRVGSLSSHPLCCLEVVMASVRTSFPDREEAAKGAASGFAKPRTEKRYSRLPPSQTLPQATQESLISMVKKEI